MVTLRPDDNFVVCLERRVPVKNGRTAASRSAIDSKRVKRRKLEKPPWENGKATRAALYSKKR